MLEPQTRTLFFEMLRPPEGYHLDEAIATTYSLDLVTLLTAPLAFTMFDWSDSDGKPTSDPVLLLEGLRRSTGRLSVFCQAGRAIAPARHGILYSYLEEMMVEVTAPYGGVFHPKMWLLRFIGPEEGVLYRFVCLSRNLTGDRCWDVTLGMDGELTDRKVGYSQNKLLGEFVAALPGLGIRPVAESVAARCARMSEEVRRADFHPPEPFDNYDIWPSGLTRRGSMPFPARAQRTLVISPFITASFLRDFAEGSPENMLVSRLDELAKLPASALAAYNSVYVLSDSVEEPVVDELPPDTAEGNLSGLHAKLYVLDHGKASSVFVGSANATTAAFTTNVELLVQLMGPRGKVGVKSFLETGTGEASLMSLLKAYEPDEHAVADDPVLTALEKELDQFRTTLAASPLRAQVSKEEGGYALTVGGADKVAVPDGIRASMWLLSVPEEANALALNARPLRFGPVPLAAVTSFFGVTASATREGRSAEARFVVNLPLEGAPAERRQAVLGALLDDPEKFLRFLQFLLGELDELGPVQGGADSFTWNGNGRWSAGSFAVFESLVRALKSDPRRLDYIETAVRELGELDGGSNRLPAGFLDIWRPVWEARRGLAQ